MSSIIGQNEIDHHRRIFGEFLDDSSGSYHQKLQAALESNSRRLIVDLNHVRRFDNALAQSVVQKPREFLFGLQLAAEDVIKKDPSLLKLSQNRSVKVGFEGCLANHRISPRGLKSHLLNHLICVEGVITKCSSVRPKLLRSVHFCSATNSYTSRDYRDPTSLDLDIQYNGTIRNPTSSTPPTRDKDGNLLEAEYGLSSFSDSQTITIQEMPERSIVGQLPRSLDVILEDDLVDTVKPGDRIAVYGILIPLSTHGTDSTFTARPRTLPTGTNHTQPSSTPSSLSVFRSILIANHIESSVTSNTIINLSPTDVINIRGVSRRPNLLSLLSSSLCPSIFGHDVIKQALVLQLLGGNEKNISHDSSGSTRLRGDINILLVGDPSTAKSQLLRSVMHVAPLAISTSGKGSSGVGLTAAIVSSEDERRLEAGAMVLADGGLVCIDEFDKMNDIDRTAIHEAMEQQTVTINKAGIHASLNARCAVLAAANPIYGRYDPSIPPQANIGLPDSLLSRFDVIFLVLDDGRSVQDRLIASHVLNMHTNGDSSHQSSSNCDVDDDVDSDDIWSKKSKLTTDKEDLLSTSFLRRYLHFCRQRPGQASLSCESIELLSQTYASIRSNNINKNRIMPVTARCYETLIRLSSAHAKMRLSAVIQEEDVHVAVRLVKYCLFHDEVDEVNEPVDDDVDVSVTSNMKMNKKAKLNETNEDDNDKEEEEEKSGNVMDSITSACDMLVQEQGLTHFHIDDVVSLLRTVKKTVTSEQVSAVLQTLSSQNKLMFEAASGQVMIV